DAQADRRFPPAAQEVPLGQIDAAEEAVHRGEPAAEGEDSGRPLFDLDVDDDPRLVGPRGGADVDRLEEPQVGQALLRPLELLKREKLPLVHGDLTAEDLVLRPDVPGDVDSLDVSLWALDDVEHEIDP